MRPPIIYCGPRYFLTQRVTVFRAEAIMLLNWRNLLMLFFQVVWSDNHQSFYLELQSSHWIGTIILSTCELIERPSKKDGFCFKLFHPMDQSIWAARGPEGETMGAVVQPLPTSHLIFRAPNNAAGKCWMDALELALRCSSLLLRTMSSSATPSSSAQPYGSTGGSKLQRSHKNSHESNPDSSNITTFSE